MNFFEQFKFCPCCAHPYTAADFSRSEMMFYCSECHYEFYQNGTPAATALIPHPDDPELILFITRNTSPGKGLLDIPGGFLRYGELPEEAVVREVREETLLDIEPLAIVQTTAINYFYNGYQVFVVETSFICTPVYRDSSHISTDEASSMGYYPVVSLLKQPERLAFPEHTAIFSKYLKDLQKLNI